MLTQLVSTFGCWPNNIIVGYLHLSFIKNHFFAGTLSFWPQAYFMPRHACIHRTLNSSRIMAMNASKSAIYCDKNDLEENECMHTQHTVRKKYVWKKTALRKSTNPNCSLSPPVFSLSLVYVCAYEQRFVCFLVLVVFFFVNRLHSDIPIVVHKWAEGTHGRVTPPNAMLNAS